MKRSTAILLAIIFTFAATAVAQKTEPAKPATLPTAEKILDKYIKALGGRKAIQKVKTRVAAGTVELVPMNLKGTFESYTAPERKAYSKVSIAGIGDIIEATDGTTAWTVNPLQGSRDRTGAELAQAKLAADFYRDIRLGKLYPKMEVKGIEKVGEKEAYVVTATAEGAPPETWYFDTQSGTMLRSDATIASPEGSQATSTFYEDHRLIDGIMIPFRVRTQTPSFQIVMIYTEVKHGTAIDDSKFAKPTQE
jgi:zinc protease